MKGELGALEALRAERKKDRHQKAKARCGLRHTLWKDSQRGHKSRKVSAER